MLSLQNFFIDKHYCGKIQILSGFTERLRGFIGYSSPPEFALLFQKEYSVHMCLMRFPLLIIILNKESLIIDSYILKPWQFGKWHFNSAAIIETPDISLSKQCSRGKKVIITTP